MIHDFIIVGSGPTGAQAAQSLIEAGVQVTMLDVGIGNERYKSMMPKGDFTSLRENDPSQHRYFLGTDFEGIQWGPVKVGAQLTPPRQFIIHDTDRLIPRESNNFTPMESLAYGGLGSGWGLGCFVFSKEELNRTGLKHVDMADAYEVVSKRIGISAARDDAAVYSLGGLKTYQQPLRIDSNCRVLYDAYRAKRRALNTRGFFMGQPPMAILTEDLDERRRTTYSDMEFYADSEASAYRPWMTIDRLQTNSRFKYMRHCLVLGFAEDAQGISLTIHRTDTDKRETVKCKRLLLACGVLGTARIVLRSQRSRGVRLPLLCNHYCYVPCIHFRQIGKAVERFRTSMAQLALFHNDSDNHCDVAVASLFSYRSLLSFRLAKEMNLNMADARLIVQYLQSGLIIAGIHHPDEPSPNKYLELRDDPDSPSGDRLFTQYSLSDRELVHTKARERQYLSALRVLGCYPIKRVYPGYGSSIHYGGTLPFGKDDAPYTLSESGRLHGTRNVYVADGSGLRFLPAKGPTLSLMANAHVVATNALLR